MDNFYFDTSKWVTNSGSTMAINGAGYSRIANQNDIERLSSYINSLFDKFDVLNNKLKVLELRCEALQILLD